MKQFGKKQLTLHLERPLRGRARRARALGARARATRASDLVITIERRDGERTFPRCCSA